MSRRSFVGGALAALAMFAGSVIAPVAARAEKVPQVYSNRTLAGSTPMVTLAWGELKLNSGAIGEVNCKNGFALSLWNKAGRGEGAFEGWGTNDCVAPTLEKAFEEILKKKVTVFATSELPVEYVGKEALVCSEPAKTKPSECKNASEKEARELVQFAHRRVESWPWNVELKRISLEGEEQVVARVGNGAEGKTCYPTEIVENEETGEQEVVTAGWEKVPAGCVKIDLVAPQVPVEVVFYGSLRPTWINGAKNGLYPSQLNFNSESGELESTKGQTAETEVLGELRILGTSSLQLMLAK